MSDDAAGDAVRVTDTVFIPRGELVVRATTGGGPGGQHVNRSATRIEIIWDVSSSQALTEEQRTRVMTKLRSRVTDAGLLRVVASDSRSQRRNRDHAERRLAELVRRGLAVPKARKRTRTPRKAVEARLNTKRQRSERKQRRRWDGSE